MDLERERSGGRAVVRLIETATESTDREVDPRLLKAIKSAVRSSDDVLRAAIEALMGKMKREHSQVRYLAVLIIDELFMRSKLFRSLLIINFDHFLSLSVGFRRKMPLPPPSNIASILRSKSIELLEKWHASFGVHYRHLRLGFEYLRNTLRYQFPNRLERVAHLQQERKEREIRSREILLNKFENLKENHSSIKGEIQLTLDQLEECLEIVHDKGQFISSSFLQDDEPEEFTSSTLWQIRQESLREGEKVCENNENAAIFDALREFYKLLVTKHLLSVQEWISVLVRVDLADNKFRDSTLKEFIDIRNLIQSSKKRCEELGCVLSGSTVQEQDENGMWEEGKIEVHDHTNAGPPEVSSGSYVDTTVNKVPVRGDYSCSTNTIVITDDNSVETAIAIKDGDKVPSAEKMSSTPNSSLSSSLRSRLLVEAPVVKSGSFLESWGSNQAAMVNYRGLELESHWGRVEQDAIIPAEKIAELSAHWCLYQEQAADIRPCLAPLKNGGLCQRKDLRVCPFHGPIIPRDSKGSPLLEKSEDVLVDENFQDIMGNPPEEGRLTEGDEKTFSEKTGGSLSSDKLSNSGKELVKQIVEQAAKNVRERDKDTKSSKRAKLARVRAHNESVLREAAFTSTSLSAAFTEEGSTSDLMLPKAKKTSLSSMLREKVTTKDRLTHRLLKARVTDAAIKQLMQAEDANYRESYPNQW
uniref:Uncharacterized protein KIAA1530 n=1 Tax=Anthurium amnicola TaxID=1678845 RepID=A0A1D1ZKC3_9ARAE